MSKQYYPLTVFLEYPKHACAQSPAPERPPVSFETGVAAPLPAWIPTFLIHDLGKFCTTAKQTTPMIWASSSHVATEVDSYKVDSHRSLSVPHTSVRTGENTVRVECATGVARR